MLEHSFRTIGNRMLAARKRLGLTQSDVADAAGLSDRTYADIERGSVNMRLETFLRICEALYVSPDDILQSRPEGATLRQEELIEKLNACTPQEQNTILRILEAYFSSLQQ